MPQRDEPFYDRRNLPHAFPHIEKLLPPDLRDALLVHCRTMGDLPADVIADEIELMLDEEAGFVSDEEIAAAFGPAPLPEPGQGEPAAPHPPKPANGAGRS